MSAIIDSWARTKKAYDFGETNIAYLGISGVSAWPSEPTPPVPVGDSAEILEFFNECFAVKRTTTPQYVLQDSYSYDLQQITGYKWISVEDASLWATGDEISANPGGGGSTYGTVVDVLTGITAVGSTDEIIVIMTAGDFSVGGQNLYKDTDVSPTSITLEPSTERIVHNNLVWRPISKTHLSFLIYGITDMSVGGILEDVADGGNQGRIQSIEQITLGEVGHQFAYYIVTVDVTGGNMSASMSIKAQGVGTQEYDVFSRHLRLFQDEIHHVYFSADFSYATLPTNVSYRRIGLIVNPELTIGVPATGSQYDEKTDNPGAVNWGQNAWYLGTDSLSPKFEDHGELYYLENREPIQRSDDQREQISVIIEF